MNEIIQEFHKLDKIPEFETVIDPQYTYTVDHCDVLQMNITRKCNLVCKHCHVDAGPHRTEEMSRETIDACMTFAKEQKVGTIDITGGAPEMNSNLEYLIREATSICDHVIVRSNLTILLDEKYAHYMDLYAETGVEIVCSLPFYSAKTMDKVRGEGTFNQAIEVLKKLNALGYGKDPKLVLNMVYNPAGAFFPPKQDAMEAEYKVRLKEDFGVEFNSLFTLYNNPMGRFGQFLIRSGNMEKYVTKLYNALNADTAAGMMCRFQISVDNDGTVYDCDFNLAANLEMLEPATIHDFLGKPYSVRKIRMDKHCYGCTAGSGSSCGGATE